MKITQIPNRIIKQPLQRLNLQNVDSIALHHMASDLDVKGIERVHINQGWRAIGYNFWVAFDGTVYEGRGFNLGAGVEGYNGHIISIGFQGDYHSRVKKMPDKQFNSGVEIINYVLSKVPSIKTIDGHKAFNATSCPGKYFPLEEMKTLNKREVEEMVYYDWTLACPEWSRPYVQKALDMGYIKGDEQGRLRLTDDKIWTLVVCMRINGIMD